MSGAHLSASPGEIALQIPSKRSSRQSLRLHNPSAENAVAFQVRFAPLRDLVFTPSSGVVKPKRTLTVDISVPAMDDSPRWASPEIEIRTLRLKDGVMNIDGPREWDLGAEEGRVASAAVPCVLEPRDAGRDAGGDAGGDAKVGGDAGTGASELPPLRRRTGFDYYFRHPWSRLLVSSVIAVLNFIMLAEDPVAHSYKEADVPVIGDGISFVLARYPDSAGLRFLKVAMWLLATVAGIAIGFAVHRLVLNRWLKLKMFEGTHGSWTVMFFVTLPTLFVFARIYTAFLKLGEGNEPYYISSLMGTSNEMFMKIAACGTWLGDFITFLMVLDMCLQQENEYPTWMPGLRAWWNRGLNRVFAFWGLFISFTVVVVTCIAADVVDHDESFGDHLLPSTEVGRTVLAAVITVMDLAIVAADWDFPSFDNPFEIKLPGFNVPEIDIKWLSTRLRLPEFFEISISGRWFNYGIILVVMCLDFNMMKNQIIYEPDDFGQYVDPDGHIWTIEDKSFLATAPEEQLTWAIRGGERSDDHRMQARYVDAPYAHRMAGATIAFLGLAVFIYTTLRGTKRADRDRISDALKQNDHAGGGDAGAAEVHVTVDDGWGKQQQQQQQKQERQERGGADQDLDGSERNAEAAAEALFKRRPQRLDHQARRGASSRRSDSSSVSSGEGDDTVSSEDSSSSYYNGFSSSASTRSSDRRRRRQRERQKQRQRYHQRENRGRGGKSSAASRGGRRR